MSVTFLEEPCYKGNSTYFYDSCVAKNRKGMKGNAERCEKILVCCIHIGVLCCFAVDVVSAVSCLGQLTLWTSPVLVKWWGKGSFLKRGGSLLYLLLKQSVNCPVNVIKRQEVDCYSNM